ncbi:hypothetical protein OIU77_022524 [Salix suchowensis]|uniref:Uncharacterized protein n=1 Tax=Salix suchowensis TaxID=1278906 RepID=A0ABQ9C4L5_9ROSI|nr:hypothetical protein OIU77_022524 [Salix suchowensis]
MKRFHQLLQLRQHQGLPVLLSLVGLRGERGVHGRKSLLRSCKCFGVEEWAMEEGRLPPVSCSLPPPPVSLARKLGAEFTGTLILIFAGTATAIVNQKTQGSETLIGLAASTGTSCDDRYIIDRPHLWSSSQPIHHHRLCCLETLPMETCATLYWGTSTGISMRCICIEGDISPFDGRGSHSSFRGAWSSFCFGVHY